ncbi:unnamed protein product [Arctogadus glacialis]
MDRDSQSEDSLSTLVLEDIKNQLINAFRAIGANHSGHKEEPCAPIGCLSLGGNQQANEELRRAKIDGAITWVRSELLEMRSQDQQLARTLLGLNSEIQRVRRESYGGLEAEGDDQP